MSSARSVALRCLERIDHDGAYANLLVPAALESSGLGERDRRFVTDLVYGTTRRRRSCDALIDRFITREPDPEVRTLLRLGAYQLEFAGVAAHAAVSETVSLASRRVRPFVNAILRSVARTPMVWHHEPERLSVPDWLYERLVDELGEPDARASMETMNAAPTVTERADGYIQDQASQWIAGSIRSSPGERVLDLCAAPGGKATAIASTGATVVAVDLQPHRVGLIAQNVRRLGAHDVLPVIGDATAAPFPSASFDHVLLDAPCSGLGTLRRRPDARWRIEPSSITSLAALQQQMIDAAVALVRPGGTFTYAVCTLTAAESIEHRWPAGLEPLTDAPALGTWRPFGSGWRVLPHDADTDGMIVLRYRRTR